MFSRLQSYLASLVFLKEEEARATARFVTYLLPSCIGVLFALVLTPLWPGTLAQRLETGVPILVVWGSSWLLLRRGKLRLASLLFISGSWLIFTYLALTRDGVRAPAYVAYLVVVIYAAFLVSPRASLTVFLLSLLAGLGLVVAALAGSLPAPRVAHTPTSLYGSYSTMMLFIVLIVLAVVQDYRDVFLRLRAGEARYRSLAESTSDWIWEVDAHGVYTYSNPKVKELLGYQPEEILGRTPYDLMPPEEAARVAAEVGPYFAQALPFAHLVNANRHKDGRLVVLDTSGVPIFDTEGTLAGYRGIDRDITGQTRAQQALQESEARYREFLQLSMDGMWRLKVDPPVPLHLEEHAQAELILQRGYIAECNEVFAHRNGYPDPESIVGATMDELWKETHDVKIAVISGFVRAGYRAGNLESQDLLADGSRRYLLSNIVGLTSDGHLLGGWGVERDITEQKLAQEALQESAERFRSTFDDAPDGMTVIDAQTRFLQVNRALCDVTGYTETELLTKTALELVIDDYRGIVSEAMRRLSSGETSIADVEFQSLTKAGPVIWIEARGRLLLPREGVAQRFLVHVRNITSRKEAEEARRESEEKSQAIVESTRDWIWFCDARGTHQYSNRAVQEMLGYAPEEIVGHPISAFMHPDDLPAARAQMKRAIAERRGWSSFVIRWRHKDGTFRYLESAATPAFDPEGDLLGWYGADRDITERIQMQQALLDSEARLRALFAAMRDVVLVMDAQGRYLEIVPTNPDLLFRPAEELAGRTVHEVFPPEQADFFLDHITRTLHTGHTVQMEYALTIGGKALRFNALVSPLSPDSVVVVSRDITALTDQQAQLLAAERARAELAEHLNDEINHRARNNLAMVSGLLQLQAAQESDPRVASQLREAVTRIRTFVDIHEKIYAADAQEADLLAVLRQVAATLHSLFIQVEADFSVEGDPCRFPTRAVTNLAVLTNELMTNALKYGGSPDGPLQVHVRVAHAEGRLRLSVWNSGHPVPEGFAAVAQKGLGLRLVTEMVEKYGGSSGLRPDRGGTLAEVVVPETALVQ